MVSTYVPRSNTGTPLQSNCRNGSLVAMMPLVTHPDRSLYALQDDSQTLECCGLGPASKVLVMRGSSPAAGAAAAASSSSGASTSHGPLEDLDRIKKSAEAMAKRYAGGGGGQGRLLSLENQV